MEDFPLALVVASQEEVFHNNNVLYRLVRPLLDGSGVQSTDKLVNVVPYRRVYTFHHKQEVIEFEQLLLARPLVLQPILHFGRGLGTCGACYNDEPWVIMLNQTHPKILGRFQMGMDLAKQAIEKGQSVEMKFCMTNLLQRVYEEHLQQKEKDRAESFTGKILTNTRFTEWEHADLIIRYHGYEAKSRTREERKHHKTFHKEWDFDDIGSHEILWNQEGEQVFPYAHNAPVSEHELRAVLPDWTINEVSPLQDIGYDVPKQNYSYSQAGRLYESFRKKKKHHPPNFSNDNRTDDGVSPQEENEQRSPTAIEHDFRSRSESQDRSLSRARRAYKDPDNIDYSLQHNTEPQPYDDYHENYHYPPRSSEFPESGASNAPSRNNNTYDSERTDHSSANTYRHVDANVLIQSSPSSQRYSSDTPNNSYIKAKVIRKQDSDRSRGSTNADSGYGDGQRSRGGSYDYNDQSRSQPSSKHEVQSFNQMSQYTDEGLVNPGFNDNDFQEDALQRHKDFVARMTTEQEGDRKSEINNHTGREFGDQVSPNVYTVSKSKPNAPYEGRQVSQEVAESFI